MITIKRFAYHPAGTLGVMQVPSNTVHKFFTIERPWLDNKPFESCIPLGEYKLKWQESPKFDWCYEVESVEGRTHILIHVANYPTDVVGCIGLGKFLMEDRIAVGRSRAAMAEFHDLTGGRPWQLKIVNAPYAALPNQ
jgi:hypothetical protein